MQCHRRQGGLRFGKALSATWNERPGVVEVSENRSSVVPLKEEGEPQIVVLSVPTDTFVKVTGNR